MDGLLSSLDDPALALVLWNEAYAAAQDRLPQHVAAELEACVAGAPCGGVKGGRCCRRRRQPRPLQHMPAL